MTNNDTQLILPRSLVNTLLSQAQASPEAEVCGLIGRPTTTHNDKPLTVHAHTSIYPISNIADDKAHRYEMDPAQQIDAFRNMRDQQQELYCIYHSHPGSPAQPSATDMREAQYPDCIYLIISLDTKGVIEMRAFRITTPSSYHEIILEITD